MRVQPNPRVWPIVIAVAFWFALILLMTSMAHAQTGGFVFSERESGQPHGRYVRAWNTTAVMIPAGTVVQADTAGSGTVPQVAIGKGFKTWTGATADFGKLMGVLMADCPGNNSTRVMVEGFLPNVKVHGAVVAGSYLRPSFTAVGRLTLWAQADSELFYQSKQVGVFQRYARTDSAMGYAWIDFSPR